MPLTSYLALDHPVCGAMGQRVRIPEHLGLER